MQLDQPETAIIKLRSNIVAYSLTLYIWFLRSDSHWDEQDSSQASMLWTATIMMPFKLTSLLPVLTHHLQHWGAYSANTKGLFLKHTSTLTASHPFKATTDYKQQANSCKIQTLSYFSCTNINRACWIALLFYLVQHIFSHNSLPLATESQTKKAKRLRPSPAAVFHHWYSEACCLYRLSLPSVSMPSSH